MKSLGFECRDGLQRAVKLKDRVFVEGDEHLYVLTSRDDELEEDGQGRPYGTLRSGSLTRRC